MDVKIYSAEGVALDEREMSLTELPPIPEWVEDQLLEIGGTCNGKPNLRIVSGLDPDIKEFVGGRWWRKYAFRSHTVNEYAILHKPDGTKRVLTKKEGEIAQKSNKIKGIIVPVVERQVIEYGIPRYFFEYYKPPEYFGSKEAWEHIRWDDGEDGSPVDLMGEFPEEGAYETWFCLEEAIEEDGQVVKTVFRNVDEVVMEYIRQQVEKIKTKTAAEQHAEVREEVDAEYIQHKEDLKENIKDIVKDRVNRLIK